ncbi:MAG: desulfoferrodoxin family protein [Bacteroidales bacterium]
MKTKNLLLLLLVMLFIPFNLFANKTSVELVVPEKAEVGDTITVKINVSHRGNSGFHHTDWVCLKIKDTEVKRWEFSRSNLPEDSDFTLEYSFEFVEAVEIKAEGNCNRHGSDRKDVKEIKLIE